MEGRVNSDATPLDTDFSEITSENLKEKSFKNVIKSTYSGTFSGSTYYIIKKDDYDETKSYSGMGGKDKTRYLRTAIGANKIRAIVTSEWTEESAYIMARREKYIPVIDFETQQVVFTKEQYDEIRDKMKGLSFYRAGNFEIDKNVGNEKILNEAEKMRGEASGKVSTEEKREKIVEVVKKILPQVVVQDMSGDLSSKIVEFIDTGSTGRGTNIPGDGDFDFMLKCSNIEERKKAIEMIKKALKGISEGGSNEFNIRYKDVKIEGLDCPVDIDVTSETKRLEVEYSSDLCVRDRLSNIKQNFGEEAYNQVIDNIIVAKKRLKEIGAYKKSTSVGGTELGGFGGIGVENWILQNGGSFLLAMETFLDNTVDENGAEISFEKFKKKYPIYDFGQNHRTSQTKGSYDHYIDGLTLKGFESMKTEFKEILKEYGIEYENSSKKHSVQPVVSQKHIEDENKKQFFTSTGKSSTGDLENYKISDITTLYRYIAKYVVYSIEKEQKGASR